MTVMVEGEVHHLRPGDALTFKSLRPHSWRNEGEDVVVAHWVITPPRY